MSDVIRILGPAKQDDVLDASNASTMHELIDVNTMFEQIRTAFRDGFYKPVTESDLETCPQCAAADARSKEIDDDDVPIVRD